MCGVTECCITHFIKVISFVVPQSYWSRLLSEKKVQVSKLQHLNTQVEKMGSRGEGITMDMQRQFAQVIVDLDDINKVSSNCVCVCVYMCVCIRIN